MAANGKREPHLSITSAGGSVSAAMHLFNFMLSIGGGAAKEVVVALAAIEVIVPAQAAELVLAPEAAEDVDARIPADFAQD
jgi:hypothetical protein